MSFASRFISNLHKLSFNLRQYQRKNVVINIRKLHRTTPLCIREVIETTEGNVTTIEGRMLRSPREEHVLKVDGEKQCVLCQLNLDLKYTDVMIISQFVQEDGEIVPRQISGICYGQHTRMKRLIHQAHSAGLMQNLRPHIYPEEYSQMSDYAWKKYNVYYNEIIDD